MKVRCRNPKGTRRPGIATRKQKIQNIKKIKDHTRVNEVVYGLGFDDLWINCLENRYDSKESPALSIVIRSHQINIDALVDTSTYDNIINRQILEQM